MITELTFAILKYGFLALLWVFVWLVVRSLRKDIETFSPRKSRAHRRKERLARKAVEAPTPIASGSGANSSANFEGPAGQSNIPTLLVIIDGPLAGASVPLTGETITLGRSSSNTVVLDDEFVSSHHARIFNDTLSHSWAIEDLGSTNGTVVNQRRIDKATVLHSRVPVRIGATTFELR